MDNKIVKVLLIKKIYNEIIDLVPVDTLQPEYKRLINTISLAHTQYEGDLNLDEIKELHLQKYIFTPTKKKILDRIISNIENVSIGSPELVRDLVKGLNHREVAREIAEKALLIHDQGSGDFDEIARLAGQSSTFQHRGQSVERYATDISSLLNKQIDPIYRFPFSLLSLQDKTTGVGRGDNVTFFGRPEIGKTSLVCHSVAGWLQHQTPSAGDLYANSDKFFKRTHGEAKEKAKEEIQNEDKDGGKSRPGSTKDGHKGGFKSTKERSEEEKGYRQTKVAYLSNEEATHKIAISICRAVFRKTTEEIKHLSVSERSRWDEIRKGLYLFDATGWSLGDIGHCCAVIEPDIIVFDQTNKFSSDIYSTINEFYLHPTGKTDSVSSKPNGISGKNDPRLKRLVDRSVGKNASSWERLGPLHTGIREVGRIFGCATVNVTQASADADGKMTLGFQNIANSKTSIPAEQDLIVGIGKYDADVVEDDGIRHLSISKNKISGIKGTWNVFFDTQRCTFHD